MVIVYSTLYQIVNTGKWGISFKLALKSIIPASQSGFKRNYSCAAALLKVTVYIITAWDRVLLTSPVLLGCTEAFNRINHNLLPANPCNNNNIIV